MEKTMKIPQNIKSRPTISNNLAIPHLATYSKELKNRISQRYLHFHVHCNIIHNSQDIETTQIPTNRGMNKEIVLYTYIAITVAILESKMMFCGKQPKNFYVLVYCLVPKSCLTLLQPNGLQPARLLCPCDSPGKNTGVGCPFLLQGIFPTQGSNPHPLTGRWILYH